MTYKLIVTSLLAALASAGRVLYTADQLKAEVVDLPGVPAGVGFKMFSGYIPVNADGSKKIFYWFVEAEISPIDSPVVMWTNGGPGCSGLGGMMTEQGPFRPTADGGLKANAYSWNKVANMIFIEQPAGVGFSEAPSNTVHGDQQSAEDNYAFVVGFFKRFPQYSSSAFYTSSESYGGHYMPTLAQELVTRGGVDNYRGFLVGNPLTYMPYRDFGQYGTYAYHQLIPQPLWTKYLKSGCQQNDSSKACKKIQGQMDELTANMDPYSLDFPVCEQSGLASGRQERHAMARMIHRAKTTTGGLGGYFPGDYEACEQDWNTDYLNRADVQAAIHVHGNVTWGMCSDTVSANYNSNDTLAPMMPVYQFLINGSKTIGSKALDILVYSGDNDAICATLGTQQWIWDLGYAVKEEWAPWNDAEGQLAGFLTKFDGFSFATVHGAGHMVPQTRPAQALELFTAFLLGGLTN